MAGGLPSGVVQRLGPVVQLGQVAPVQIGFAALFFGAAGHACLNALCFFAHQLNHSRFPGAGLLIIAGISPSHPPPLTCISLPKRKAASLHLFAANMRSNAQDMFILHCQSNLDASQAHNGRFEAVLRLPAHLLNWSKNYARRMHA